MKTITRFICPAFAALALACFAVLSTAQAVNPPPDGGYSNGNTAEGESALYGNTTGGLNTAVGDHALSTNTTGSANTAVGSLALFENTTGIDNTGLGVEALFFNSTGYSNTATGTAALSDNETGFKNVADGFAALLSNRTGYGNTADGSQALYSNTTGSANTAVGLDALFYNETGDSNTATGYLALMKNTTGSYNTALGFGAGTSVTTASNVICISHGGSNVSNTTWIGNVYGVTTQSGTTAPVIVSDSGQLGIMASSERFKKDISTMEKTSEAILSLRPVTFHYKTDPKDMPQFGLIAEEVAKVNPGLVLPDKEGKPYTVRYDAVNAMLLNEFLKEHRKNEEQEKTVAELKSGMTALAATVKEQSAQIQKVSAQLEARKPAPQVVNNP